MTDTVEFDLGAESTRAFETTGGDTLRKGWIRIRSDGVLKAASVFRLEAGGQVFEAGVPTEPPSRSKTLFVENRPNGLGTGVALANVRQDDEVGVELELAAQGGSVVARATLQLVGQRAFFIREVFPAIGSSPFKGTLRIKADEAVSTVALRTLGGRQLSSYP